MKRLLDGIALVIILLGCIFEFMITWLVSEGHNTLTLDIPLLYTHSGLMVLSALWLFARTINNWKGENNEHNRTNKIIDH